MLSSFGPAQMLINGLLQSFKSIWDLSIYLSSPNAEVNNTNSEEIRSQFGTQIRRNGHQFELAPATTCNRFRNSLSPSTHQNMADKSTRIHNETEDAMVFVTKDQYNATRKTKMIGAGKHIDLSYRDGMVSSNPFIRIHYEIYPANKDNGWSLREKVLPIQVFDHSEIKISYNTESGKVTLAYETGGFIQRLRMVRWMKDLFSG